MSMSTSRIRHKIYSEIFGKGFSSIYVILLLALFGIAIGILTYLQLYLVIGGLLGVFAGSMVLFLCLFYPLKGFYFLTFLAFFAVYPNHLFHKEFGLSTVVELLMWFLFFGTLRTKNKITERGNLLKYPVSIVLIIYTGYQLVQLFNPDLGVKEGYFFTMRKFAVFILMYYIGYRLINTPSKVRFFLKFWLLFSFIAAAYGCFQQWFGYLPQELAYIRSDEKLYKLMYQGGQIRIFSFLTDVVTFGVLAGSMAVFSIVLAINEKDKKKKRILIFISLIMALGMSYSGTRTTTIILPVGMALYFIMTIKNRATLVAIFSSFLLVLFVLFAPIYSNKTLNRIRSTFDENDASLDVRNVNRHYIQPYIYSHPIGGGLATSGVNGKRFNPTHFLAGFPPDSGLLQIALETGWVGLLLTLIWYLVILYQAIIYYYKIRNPEYKTYMAAIACSMISVMVTQYSQVSIGQMPSIIFFMAISAIMSRLNEFDQKEIREKEINLLKL